jgi:hypothetical protein
MFDRLAQQETTFKESVQSSAIKGMVAEFKQFLSVWRNQIGGLLLLVAEYAG